MNKFKYFIALALLLAAPLLARPVYADAPVLYLTPASGSFSQGSVITVQIRENSGTEAVNAVQANLNYDPTKLDFNGIASSAVFSVEAESYNDSGLIKVARGAYAPVSGDQLVASVQFTAKEAGSTTINFTSRTAVVSTPAHIDLAKGSYSGATYVIEGDIASQTSQKINSQTGVTNQEQPAPAQVESQNIDLLNLLANPDDYAVHVL